jgi:hypothetical protein
MSAREERDDGTVARVAEVRLRVPHDTFEGRRVQSGDALRFTTSVSLGATQVCTSQVRAAQVRVHQIRAAQVRAAQVRVHQIGTV